MRSTRPAHENTQRSQPHVSQRDPAGGATVRHIDKHATPAQQNLGLRMLHPMTSARNNVTRHGMNDMDDRAITTVTSAINPTSTR